MFSINLFGKKKLLLAFEYGMMMSEAAKDLKVPLTRELMERAEEVIMGEFPKKDAETLAFDMGPNLLAIFAPVDKQDKPNKTKTMAKGSKKGGMKGGKSC